MDTNIIKFINYNSQILTSPPTAKTTSISPKKNLLSDKAECSYQEKPLPDIKTDFLRINSLKSPPILLINIYNSGDRNTNYERTITNKKLENALFVYLSHNGNSGYKGGEGDGTAAIGNKDNTFGIITGHYDETSEIETGGFQDLNDERTFKLCHRGDNATYSMTPKQAIDYLVMQLYDIIETKKYDYIILPCDLKDNKDPDKFESYTIGAKIFNTAPAVKDHIYDSIIRMTSAMKRKFELVSNFLKKP